MAQQPQSAMNKGDRWAAFRGLSWWQMVLTLLPLALIALGGLVGGAVGGAGAWANLKVARSAMHPAVKALVMIVVVGAAYVVWSVIAVAIKSMLAS
ncbi:MAG TPA: hypothetical protein VFC19_23965 [Candidatus Limnocylindrales bacterium]|nr:hypothetical protein [Candidatus Limnocylindrales bacterium]